MACGPKGHAISIHALLAESDREQTCIKPIFSISIHALLAESDGQEYINRGPYHIISIHALLAESDYCRRQSGAATSYFYPRSPCGERLWANFSGFYWWVISIHALLAESDSLLRKITITVDISIHALLAESDMGLDGRFKL